MKSTAEIVGLTGITREKLYYLEDSGCVRSMRIKQGNREIRHWHDEDVELIRRIWVYIQEGVRIRAAFERAQKEVENVSALRSAPVTTTRVFAFANQKGGVGKTSMCFHVAGAYADQGWRVLCIDLDQQGNLSSALVDDIYSVRGTVTDLFLHEETDINELIVPTRTSGVSLIVANLDFSSIDMKLAADKYADEILQLKLRSIVEPFDVVLIDAPPSLGIATRAALNATHDLIIPVECQKWSVIGTRHLDSAVKVVQSRSNPLLRLSGYLINKYSASRAVEQQYRDMLLRRHKQLVFETEIRNYVAYTEAVAKSLPITQYKPNSEEANVIRNLSKEMIARYAQRQVNVARAGAA